VKVGDPTSIEQLGGKVKPIKYLFAAEAWRKKLAETTIQRVRRRNIIWITSRNAAVAMKDDVTVVTSG
jgi:hypothetical protein